MTLKEVRGFEKVIEAARRKAATPPARRGRRRRIIREAALVAGALAMTAVAWFVISALFLAGDLISK